MAHPTSPDLSSISSSRFLSVLDLNDQHHHSNMDNMDIDLVTVIDTPDRKVNCGVKIGDTQNSSMPGSSGISNLLDKGVRNRVKEHSRSNIENPNKVRLFSRPRGSSGIRGEPQQNNHQVVDLVDSPSVTQNARLYKRMMTEKVSSQPQSSSNNDRAKLGGDTSSIAELLADDYKSQGKNKETINDSISTSKMPSSAVCIGGRNQRKKNSFQGNDSVDINDCLRSSTLVGVNGEKRSHLHCDFKQNTDQMVPRAQQSTTLPRKSGQRRLVRNGCISPNNIAKAKCTTESHDNSRRDDKQDGIGNVVSELGPQLHQIHSTNPTSGENHANRVKGKGVMVECLEENHVNGTMHFSRSSTANPTKEAVTDSGDGVRVSEEMDGWRCTRNRSNNPLLKSSDGVEHLPRTSGIVRSQEISNLDSSHHQATPFSSQASSRVRSDVDGEKGRYCGTSNPVRRQRKRGSDCSNNGECSTSVFDESDISLVWPSEGPSNARSTRNRSHHRHGNLHSVIEIDDASPDEQCDAQNTTQVVNDDSYARERQMEADEILARELQEQFYHELPGLGAEEVDANIAWTLQHEEEAQRASSLRRQRVHPRDASMSHLYRHNQIRSIQNSLIRSATSQTSRGRARARAPNSTRAARGRQRFLDNSRTTSLGERSISFHPNLDIEMRMHILEVLEAAAGTAEPAMPSSFFDLQRDFNENDYEMLLALDENNHQHVGATSGQINGLPESTVQTENFEEACAICLETPSIGDTVRHLPCFHKFHKDCIDPWLRRKTACPICKSDVT